MSKIKRIPLRIISCILLCVMFLSLIPPVYAEEDTVTPYSVTVYTVYGKKSMSVAEKEGVWYGNILSQKLPSIDKCEHALQRVFSAFLPLPINGNIDKAYQYAAISLILYSFPVSSHVLLLPQCGQTFAYLTVS